jgi:hypothetical protein
MSANIPTTCSCEAAHQPLADVCPTLPWRAGVWCLPSAISTFQKRADFLPRADRSWTAQRRCQLCVPFSRIRRVVAVENLPGSTGRILGLRVQISDVCSVLQSPRYCRVVEQKGFGELPMSCRVGGGGKDAKSSWKVAGGSVLLFKR